MTAAPDTEPHQLSWEEIGRAAGQLFSSSMSDLHDQIGALSESVAELGHELRRTGPPDTDTAADRTPGTPSARTLAYALGQLAASKDSLRTRTSRGVPVPRTRD